MIDHVPPTIAAVDLGSNSFHMIVAETANGEFRVVDKMRDMVRLAAGLDDDNELDEPTMARAIITLERFGERLRELDPGSVRVVGTNTLRKARNSEQFVSRAESALGHSIDIIAGSEEARLIYLGVSHGLEDDSELRLVIDIGGGSTEFILGRHFDPLLAESLHMGCVSMSNEFFADGRITADAMGAAEIHARQELEHIEEKYRAAGWQSAIGASGTNLAIHDVIIKSGLHKDGITKRSLASLKDLLIEAGHVDKLKFEGLSNERRPVFVGGVVILSAAFKALGIEVMRVSDSALREGLLYDLLGRIQHEDVRERTVEALIDRYQIDRAQGDRVYETARDFYQQVAGDWSIDQENYQSLIHWASQLHEIGRAIAHSQYQKHGEYLLTNMDMPGFARREQRQLAVLVRSHRRKMQATDFEQFNPLWQDVLKKMAVLVRLSVVLHRRRSQLELPEVGIRVDNMTVRLKFPDEWLVQHPLTRADLEQEADYLRVIGVKLKFK